MRIVWATNAAAPYRVPVWDSIAETHELRVLILENDEKLRDGSLNRGADWAKHESARFSMRMQRTWALTRGESRYYTFYPKFKRSLLRDAHVVLLGGWESPAYWQLLAEAKVRGIRTVGFYESTRMSQGHTGGVIAWARSRFFGSLDAVVVPGLAAQQAVLDMGVAPERIFVGFNAVDGVSINNGSQAARSKIAAPIGHRYLCIAQLIDRKNVSSLIRAFSEVRGPHDVLTIAGTGPLEANLRALAAGMPVRFEGYVPYRELPGLLARHDTLVLPSASEVWGLVVNEALAAGLHAVVSDRCGVVDSVRGMDGTFVCTPDVRSIASGMTESRAQWQGPITNPAILKHGPGEFAAVFCRSFQENTAE